MQKGTVKWFDPKLGYGFILPDGREDIRENHIFLHFNSITESGGGYKTVNQDDKVEFDVEPGKNGKSQAANVRVV
jgi:CspA family cold shock protein